MKEIVKVAEAIRTILGDLYPETLAAYNEIKSV